MGHEAQNICGIEPADPYAVTNGDYSVATSYNFLNPNFSSPIASAKKETSVES